MNLYPLKFKPILKNKIWGGQKLIKYGKTAEAQSTIGEAWELSGLTGNVSVVTNGFLEGNDINDLLEVYMGDLVGDEIYELFGNEFPLLFKLIDANDKLSIQVHPDNETAFQRHGSFGKTEMWYVLEAEPGAQLIVGFDKECDRQTYVDALDSSNVESLLKKINVRRGDVLLINPGCVHSIGKGILLAEIQQSSDITYRIYDYNRTDQQGNTRQLHIREALDVIDFTTKHNPIINYKSEVNHVVNLVKCPFFTTNLISFDRLIGRDYTALDSFVVYMCVEGNVVIKADGADYSLAKGETILIPASLNELQLNPQGGEARLLEVYSDKADLEE